MKPVANPIICFSVQWMNKNAQKDSKKIIKK